MMNLLFTDYMSSFINTGNSCIDGILLILLFSLIPIISKKINIYLETNNIYKILENFGLFKKKYKYTISLLSKEITNYRTNIKSTKNYTAVSYYIIVIKGYENVKHLEENSSTFEVGFGESYENDEGELTKNKYFPYNIKTDNVDVLIEDDIYCRSIKKNDIINDEHSKKSIKITNLILMSDTKNIKEIREFINKCVEIFNKIFEDPGPKIFDYESGSKYVIECEASPFDYVKEDIKDCIFDNYDKINKALERFKDIEYYNNHVGVRRKITGLFYGVHGTGKTYIARLIAQHLKRHIVMVNFKSIKTYKQLKTLLFFDKIGMYNISSKDVVIIIDDIEFEDSVMKKNKEIKKVESNSTNNLFNAISKLNNNNKTSNEELKTVDPKKEDKLNIKDVLRLLDGIRGLDGQVIIFSTNTPLEKINSGFMRDQRINLLLEFTLCSKEVVQKTIEKWYSKKLTKGQAKIIPDKKYSKSQLTAICLRCDTLSDVLNEISIR